ncbi:MAG: flavin reductase family protein [Chloroflexi bacterium]|nr:flavin reductase family protein [Chloroflexota bacterium]
MCIIFPTVSKIEIDLARASRLLQPGPIALVTAKHKNKANVMVAAWVTNVSNDPPMVALAVHPARFTHDLIQKSGQFALNIPPRPRAEQVKKIGEVSGADIDKFVLTKLNLYEAKQVNAPLIVECIGHLECGVVDTIRAGNHILFLAEIVAASADELAFDGERWTLADESVKPLHHLGGNWYAMLEGTISV